MRQRPMSARERPTVEHRPPPPDAPRPAPPAPMTAEEARAFTSKLSGFNQEQRTPPRFRKVLGEVNGNEQGAPEKPPVKRDRTTWRDGEEASKENGKRSPPPSPPPPPPGPRPAPSARRRSFPEAEAEKPAPKPTAEAPGSSP